MNVPKYISIFFYLFFIFHNVSFLSAHLHRFSRSYLKKSIALLIYSMIEWLIFLNVDFKDGYV